MGATRTAKPGNKSYPFSSVMFILIIDNIYTLRYIIYNHLKQLAVVYPKEMIIVSKGLHAIVTVKFKTLKADT